MWSPIRSSIPETSTPRFPEEEIQDNFTSFFSFQPPYSRNLFW
jgi:hypothetical protein